MTITEASFYFRKVFVIPVMYCFTAAIKQSVTSQFVYYECIKLLCQAKFNLISSRKTYTIYFGK